MKMDWTHILVLVVAVAVGMWIGAKNPGLLSKATGGVVAA